VQLLHPALGLVGAAAVVLQLALQAGDVAVDLGGLVAAANDLERLSSCGVGHEDQVLSW
jgi:hypothetical protein